LSVARDATGGDEGVESGSLKAHVLAELDVRDAPLRD
jgi:hypothetical protein